MQLTKNSLPTFTCTILQCFLERDVPDKVATGGAAPGPAAGTVGAVQAGPQVRQHILHLPAAADCLGAAC